MASTTQYVTADELFRMPDDGWRYELVRGELRKMSPAGARHGRVAAKFMILMGTFIDQRKLGVVYGAETGFRLASQPDTVLAPDFSFVNAERAEAIGNVVSFFPGPPDLAVEAISPSDSYSEVEEKALSWLEHGCKVLILADSAKRRLVIRRPGNEPVILSEDDRLEVSDLLPGWSADVKSFFE